MTARYIVGDVFDVLATLEPDSVDLIFTSPPFLALRSYLPADHPDKGKEVGGESTPADFLDTLLDVVEACDRVLAPHGSLCFELGDTYSGSGGGGGDYPPGGLREGQPGFAGSAAKQRIGDAKCATGHGSISSGTSVDVDRDTRSAAATAEQSAAYQHHPECDLDGDCSCDYLIQRDGNAAHWRAKNIRRDDWPLAKSLRLIPSLFAASLAYGHNMLRPERTTPRWRIRNQIVWARPNPPVGALGDKYRPATSYVTVVTKSPSRYFDLDAVRTPGSRDAGHVPEQPDGATQPGNTNPFRGGVVESNPAGAPPLDYWVIPTHPYPGAHYATFPPDLVVKPVKSMCPQRVCRVCGEPSRRIVDKSEEYAAFMAAERGRSLPPVGERSNLNTSTQRMDAQYETLGWTDCECSERDDRWRPGCVLDPFAGSGTTLAVATGHGRDAIGIDLDERNAELALDRVGPMFLTVEYLSEEAR